MTDENRQPDDPQTNDAGDAPEKERAPAAPRADDKSPSPNSEIADAGTSCAHRQSSIRQLYERHDRSGFDNRPIENNNAFDRSSSTRLATSGWRIARRGRPRKESGAV